MSKPIIGITSGDLNGIGLETVIKTFSDSRMLDLCVPVIFASQKSLNFYRKTIPDINFIFTGVPNLKQLNTKQVNVFNCWQEDVPLNPGQFEESIGKYAVRSILVATQCLKDHELDAVVTAPIHKLNTHTEDFNYTGHTPFFKDQFGARDVVMMLYNGDFKVALVTEHLPLKDVSKTVTKELIMSKAKILNQSLKRDFGITAPKIAVLALNPHAGDGGLIGHEEEEVIVPAINALKEAGILAFGPFSADGYFAHDAFKHFDATLAMYHDQGLIPLKALAGNEGVNYTCGLPIVRTSPDHGTAFDIAGKNMADESSLRAAVFEAIEILRHRNAYDENTANPLQKQRLSKER